VLAQQSARYLLGCLRKAMSGKTLSGSTAYLAQTQQILSSESSFSVADATILSKESPAVLINALRWLSAKQLTAVALSLQTQVASGKGQEEVWNDNLLELISCSRVHTWYYVLQFFANHVSQEQDPSTSILATTLFSYHTRFQRSGKSFIGYATFLRWIASLLRVRYSLNMAT
jgi:hypothetical protein